MPNTADKSTEPSGNGTKLYGWIVAVGALCLIVIGLVAAFIPDQTPMLAAIVTGFGLAIIAQLFNAQKLTKIEVKAVEAAEATAANAEKLDATDGKIVKMRDQLDGRLEKLLESVERAAEAKGRLQAKEEAATTAAAVAVETAATALAAAASQPEASKPNQPIAVEMSVKNMKVDKMDVKKPPDQE